MCHWRRTRLHLVTCVTRQACIICLGHFGGTRGPLSNLLKWTNTEKGGNKRAGSSLEQRALFIWMLYMLYPVFPNGPPGKGEWDRGEAKKQDTFASSPTSWLHILIESVLDSLTAHLALLPLKAQKVTGSWVWKGGFEMLSPSSEFQQKTVLATCWDSWSLEDLLVELKEMSLFCDMCQAVVDRECQIGKISCKL